MDYYKFSPEYCQNLIDIFSKEKMENQVIKNSPYAASKSGNKFSIYSDNEKYNWLWNDVDNLIKNNLGNNHYLTLWVIVNKYNVGDYFSPHTDRYNQDDDRYLSGGVEISDYNDFEGGKFVVNGSPLKFERGKLLTHKVTEWHEITEVTRGTRWSLHFGINKTKDII